MVEFPWNLSEAAGASGLVAGTYTHERVLVEEQLCLVSLWLCGPARDALQDTYDVASTLENSVGGRQAGETTTNNDNLGGHDLGVRVASQLSVGTPTARSVQLGLQATALRVSLQVPGMAEQAADAAPDATTHE